MGHAPGLRDHVNESAEFGRAILIASIGFAAAIISSRLSERLRLPSPALFLAVAAIASDLAPQLGRVLSIRDVERIGVMALIVILFDGGMEIGWSSFRGSLVPIVSLGVVGTFAVAGLIALAMHGLFGLSWTSSLLVGAALIVQTGSCSKSTWDSRPIISSPRRSHGSTWVSSWRLETTPRRRSAS